MREQAKSINWDDISFPTKVNEISIWERNNDNKYRVNVFGFDSDSKKIYSIRLADQCNSIEVSDEDDDPTKYINLFLHDDNHYCVIRNISRLISSGLSKHQHKKHFCLRCLNGFSTQDILTQHQEICLEHKSQTHVYPNPGDKIKFKNVEKSHDIPFVVYADFECFVKPIEGPDKDSNRSYTTKYQNHEPSGFCYTIKCVDENIYPTKTVLKMASYDGENMGKLFIDTLTDDLGPIYKILRNPKPIKVTKTDEFNFK